MTPSQTQALLQEVKDEVAKKHSYGNWQHLIDQGLRHSQFTTKKLQEWEDECIELYHTRLLAEAGRELPTLEQMRLFNNETSQKTGYYLTLPELFEWMKDKAESLLAAKQAEIGELRKCIEFASAYPDEFRQKQTNDLKSQLEAAQKEKGDKKFSLKDMEECFNKSRQVQVGFNDYINSLTPKEHSEGEGREDCTHPPQYREWHTTDTERCLKCGIIIKLT